MNKILTTLLLAATATAAMAQGADNSVAYTVSGTCPTDVKTIYVVDPLHRAAAIDSVATNGGKFLLEGHADKDAMLGLATEQHASYAIFIVDGTPISADMATKELKGSALNTKLNAYDRQIDAISAQMQPYMQQYMDAQASGKSQEELKALAEELTNKYLNPIQERLIDTTKAIIRGNLDNIIPAAFIEGVMYDCEYDELLSLLDTAHPFTLHPMAGRAMKYLEAMKQKMAIIGTPFKDLQLNDTDGQPHKLSEYVGKGNYVMIDFWASWCGPCRAEMPNVKANYEKYHAKGFDIVGLSFDSKAEAWKKGIADLGITWTNLSDLKGWQSAAAEAYGIRSIPSSLLVGPDGKVVALDLRADKLGAKLKEIYGF